VIKNAFYVFEGGVVATDFIVFAHWSTIWRALPACLFNGLEDAVLNSSCLPHLVVDVRGSEHEKYNKESNCH
jgi:hypothetical protein